MCGVNRHTRFAPQAIFPAWRAVALFFSLNRTKSRRFSPGFCAEVWIKKGLNHVRRRLAMEDKDFTDFTEKELPIRAIRWNNRSAAGLRRTGNPWLNVFLCARRRGVCAAKCRAYAGLCTLVHHKKRRIWSSPAAQASLRALIIKEMQPGSWKFPANRRVRRRQAENDW